MLTTASLLVLFVPMPLLILFSLLSLSNKTEQEHIVDIPEKTKRKLE